MDDTQQLIRRIRPTSTSPLEVLGFLHQLSRDAAEGNLTRVMDASVEIPVRCLGIDRAILLHRSSAEDSYSPIAFRNISVSFLDNCYLLPEDQLIARAISNQSPNVVDDISSLSPHSTALLAGERVHSLACIPVILPVASPAVLLYMCSTRPPLTVWEIELLCTIANLVSSTMQLSKADGSALSADSHPLINQLRDAAFSATNLQTLLDKTLEVVLEVLQADSASIMLREGGWCRLAASKGLKHAPGLQVSTDSVSNRVIAGGQPILLNGPVDPIEFPGSIPRADILSSMSVPLQGRQRIIGLLNVNSKTPGKYFGNRELTLATLIGRHIALGVENIKLQEAAKAQTRYLGNLYRIARTITSCLELDTVLHMIVDRLRTLSSSDVCALLLYNRESGQIQLSDGYGIPGGIENDYIDLVLPAAKLFNDGRRSLVISDLSTESSYSNCHIARNLGIRSAAFAPILIKGKVTGFAAIFSRDLKGFPRQIIRSLLGLTELAAIAIENARLYQRQSGIAKIATRELTPGTLEPIPGFDVATKYMPAHQVGGDYYDIIKLGKRKFGIVVADVSGKDTTAAIHISMCKHSLRALAEHIPSPSALMRKLNRLVYEHTDPETFVSMFYGILDISNNSLFYTSAGHEPGLLYRTRSGQVEEINSPGLILGVIPDATFCQRKTSIQAGDTLLLYTDGLLEVTSNDVSDGTAKLRELLSDSSLKNAGDLADNLLRLALTKHDGRAADDIALLVLKRE